LKDDCRHQYWDDRRHFGVHPIQTDSLLMVDCGCHRQPMAGSTHHHVNETHHQKTYSSTVTGSWNRPMDATFLRCDPHRGSRPLDRHLRGRAPQRRHK
jgi:hypothetical protein